ncbi:MAG TPA: ABC transporter permease, partial [Thauera aminoaromatica]|nr:ABC transporter permease [Thauera aminoaromatica]HNO64344.1 ABC transporter permease [Thauera aminoaromatica]HNV90026.1 ABC transporter permease [Thauera aminoaromatica]
MPAFILRRLLQSVLVMLTVALVAFGLFRFIGDPVNNMVGQEATMAERAALRESLGLDDPVPVQFLRFVVNAAQGEFGVSYRMARPVADVIAERLPATLELALISGFGALALGIALGVYTALRRDGWLSHAIMSLSLVGVSLPTFLIGILLIYVFAVELKLLPAFGRGEVVDLGWWTTGLLTTSGLKSLVMPAITLGLYQLTLIMRLVRAEMLEVLRTDYIKFAR